MSPATYKDPVEAFGPQGPHPALGEGVGPRRTDRRADHGNALGPEDLVEGTRELGVAVADQEPDWRGSVLERGREVAGLLADPGGVGVSRDAGHVHPPGAQLDEVQDVDSPQPKGLHGEEVTGQDAVGLGLEELGSGRARTPGSRVEAMSPQDSADGRGPDADAEPAELTLDPHVAPPRILSGQAQDRVPELRVDRGPPGLPRPTERPLPAHQLAVPPQERLWRDQEGRPSVPG